MTLNLSNKPQADYALFTPALSSFYNSWLSQWDKKLSQLDKNNNLKYPNRNPKTLSQDAKELYFLDENNGSFYYDCALFSAGHAHVDDLNESQQKEKVIYRRNKQKTTIIADSGGFQIASAASGSSLSGWDWSNIHSQNNDKIRLNILRWMESIADYSMMLDVPTYAIANKKTSINSFNDCMIETTYNADFFVKHRVPGATKILNILQGRSKEEADIWYNHFKSYPFEGWAMGGANVKNIELMLHRIITMRDENMINSEKSWMHVLGTSRLSSACLLTSIQRAIKDTVYDKFTISYDSATAFVVASKGFVLTHNAFEGNKKNPRFSYLSKKFIEHVDAVKSDRDFPFTSIPGRFLTVGDICCRDPKLSGTKTTWDSFSYTLLMWHNLYRQIDSIQEALRIYDMPSSQVTEFVPKSLLEFKDLCPEIFKSERPFDLINKHKKLLQNLTGTNGVHEVNLLEETGSNLFEWDTGQELANIEDWFDPSEGRETDPIELISD